MANPERHYWLHRITGGENARPIAERLLENNHYLSIGWADLSYDDLIKDVKNEKWEEVRTWFEDEGYSLAYSAWCLIRFIKDMKPGDYVVVPSWGVFSVYEIVDNEVLSNESADSLFQDWGEGAPYFDEKKYLRNIKGDTIDLGFYRKVKLIEKDIPRSDYAKANLISRMKIRQTNACIDDLGEQVLEAITAHKAQQPINLKSNILQNTIESTLGQIQQIVDPDKLEALVEWYMKSLGAEWVKTPAKNGTPTDKGDADREARFEKLKHIIVVQVKKHKETTGDWAVQQILAYKENTHFDDYSVAMWVISTCDQFSQEAIELAEKFGVRLIDGREFTQMILENGLNGMEI